MVSLQKCSVHVCVQSCIFGHENGWNTDLICNFSNNVNKDHQDKFCDALVISFHPAICIHSTDYSSALCKAHSSPALLQLPRFPTDPVPCFPYCCALCHQHFAQTFQFGSVPVQVQLCVFLQLLKHSRPAFIQCHVGTQHRVKAKIHVRW